jgi:DNA-binding response OmpR family regulator
MTRPSLMAPWSDATSVMADPSARSIDLDRPPLLGERSVIVAELGRRGLGALSAALKRAGASVQVVSELTGVRRSAALLGQSAAVIIDAPANTPSLWEGISALSRQDAVLLVSATATSGERIALLRRGADYVLSAPEPDELVAALVAVLRRVELSGTTKAPESLCCGPISVHLPTRTAASSGDVLTLTALEFDLLAYFVRHAGEALSRERLLADVWGYDIGGLETVTVHLRRLRCKIEADPSRPELLQTVWGVGYRMAAGDRSLSRTPGGF